MIILVSCNNFVNDFKDMMDDIANRLSIVQPRIYYREHLIEVELATMSSIKIIFLPALKGYVIGARPEYYWTNSYEVDKYFRECITPKCLQNFTELTNLVLQTCQKDEEQWSLVLQTCQKDEEQWSLIKDLGVKYCDTPGLPSNVKCNCLKETQIESYFNTIDRNLREDTKPCSFCESFEAKDKGDHIYRNEDGEYFIMADTGDCFQWGSIYNVHYCPYCGRRLENDDI